jgi:hemerythrin-like domain-containing protein
MSETMRRMRQDHANLLRLLAALERQALAMQRGDKTDWDIVQRIVEYCLTYPDFHHHPIEDQVLARFRSKDAAAAAPFIGLEAEHRELATSLRSVATAIKQVLQDATVPVDWFVNLVSKFVNMQREHIRREESEFYPAAERALATADWADLDMIVSRLPVDPLFDRPTNRQYLALLSDIKAGEAPDAGDSG